MTEKGFRILLALSDSAFTKRAVKLLENFYRVDCAGTIKEFSDHIHKGEFDLIVIDYRFGGMKAEDVYQGVEFMHPNAIFIVYTDREKKTIAKRLWKRRAIDFINHTPSEERFVQSINKAMRWTIQKRDTIALERTLKNIENLVQDVKAIVRRWK